MEALGLKDVSKPESTETGVSLGALAAMTGFPVDYIKRELMLDCETLDVDELRIRVMNYLNSNF